MNLYVHIIAAKIFAPLIIFVIVKKSFVKKDKERATNSLYINEINSNLTKKLFNFFIIRDQRKILQYGPYIFAQFMY